MNWEIVDNELSNGITLYKGYNAQIPVKAWAVLIPNEKQSEIKILVSNDQDGLDTPESFAIKSNATVVFSLPNGEKIKDVKKIIDENALGVLLSCVSPENFEKNLKELKSLNIPFGFKLNGFVTTKLRESYTSVFLGKKSNPNEILGKRQDLTPTKIQEIAKKFKDAGATILGGCCETSPSHIKAIANLK